MINLKLYAKIKHEVVAVFHIGINFSELKRTAKKEKTFPTETRLAFFVR